jgi:hypothetical protein
LADIDLAGKLKAGGKILEISVLGYAGKKYSL